MPRVRKNDVTPSSHMKDVTPSAHMNEPGSVAPDAFSNLSVCVLDVTTVPNAWHVGMNHVI